MSEPAKSSWAEADVNDLIGQLESIRREFKSGRMFDGDQKQKWIDQLSKEVSAFANTEGGDLFLGIDEDSRSSRPKVAAGIDGVPAEIGPERLQQLIESNVSSYLLGIRVRQVRLSARADRVVFVVQIP
jgi:predicted HTH transcriptional regulator